MGVPLHVRVARTVVVFSIVAFVVVPLAIPGFIHMMWSRRGSR